MKIYLSVILLSLSLMAYTQTTPNCPEEFIIAYENMESAFINTYGPSANKEDLDNLKTSMKFFLQDHSDTTCLLDHRRMNPTAQVETLLSQLKTTPLKYVKNVIYGEDDRVEVDESPEKRYARWADSTAAKIHVGRIKPDGGLDAKTFGKKFCESERFLDQVRVAQCTGFLIGQDILLTSGHCMTAPKDCSNFRWVFGFHKGVERISPINIYKCSEVISHQYMGEDVFSVDNRDYSIIRLDRPVLYRYPLLFREDNKKIDNSAELLIIGHPSGIPTKIADNGRVLSNNSLHYFTTDLDAFAGNSGSPVINTNTGLVEGVLRFGERDYEDYINEQGEVCNKAKVCQPNQCDGEKVTRINSVEGIPSYLYPLSKREILQGLFNPQFPPQKPFISVDNPGVLPFLGHQKRTYILAGKKFLRICGLHIVRVQDSSWQSYFVGNCTKNTEKLDDIYKNFLKLIRFF